MASPLRFISENWQLKLLAIVLASLLWVGVSAEQPIAQWLPVSFSVDLQDTEFRLIAASVPENVEVRFEAPGRLMWDLATDRPELVLRVTEVDEESQTFILSPQMVGLRGGPTVRAVDVRPNTVRLRFERLGASELPVRVPVTGLRPGYSVVGVPSVRPERVRVSGPARQLADLEFVQTVPMDLSAAESTFVGVVDLDVAPLRGLRLGRETVEVSGRVDRVAERVLPAVAVEVGQGISVLPGTVSLRLRGPQSVLRGILPGALRVVVAIDSIPVQIPPTGLPVPLRVERLPPGVTAVVQPETARLLPPPRRPEMDTAPPPLAPDTLASVSGFFRG